MNPPPPPPTPPPVSLTPLIDVVFLLIIFFLVSSHLSRRENLTPVTLPSAATGRSVDERPRLTVTVQRGGKIRVAGTEQTMAQFSDRLRTDDGTTPALRIRCDADALYQTLSPVLSAAAVAGCTDIVLATRPGVGEP